MSPTGLLVLWRVFEHCNLGCHFCAYSKHLQRPRVTADVQRVLAFGSVLGEYSRQFQRTVQVSWMGGEPLLWPALPKLTRTFRTEFGLQLGATSNGLPLESKSVRASLIEDYTELTLSIDGLAEHHDWCRDSPGLFDRIRDHIRLLRSEVDAAGSPLILRVNTILMRNNIATFEPFCREVASWGIRELTFNQLGGQDRPEFYPANRLLPEQVARFADELPQVRERLAPLGLTISGTERYLERLASTAENVPIAIEDCDPGRSFLFIDERERVAPCSYTTAQYGIPMNEITNAANLDQLPELFAITRSDRAPACDDCLSTRVFDKFTSVASAKPLPMAALP